MNPTLIALAPAMQFAGGLTSELFSPGTMRFRQANNANAPVVIPDVSALLGAYYRGYLTDEDVNAGLLANGIDTRPLNGKPDDWRRKLWSACNQMVLTTPGPADIISGYWRGLVDFTELPASITGSGGHHAHWMNRLDLYQGSLNLDTLFTLWRRGRIGDDGFRHEAKMASSLSDARIELLQELKDLIPPPGDLIQMSVKDVFDPQVISELQLFKEFPPEFDHWMRKQGFGGLPGVKFKDGDEERDATWSHLYWGAHWANISPTQIYEMLHRFRPGRVKRELEFTDRQAALYLKVHDYNPAIRERLISLSYRTLGRIDVRRLHKSKQIDTTEAIERYQDIGFTKADAALLGENIDKEKDSASLKSLQKRMGEKILQAHSLGLYNPQQVDGFLRDFKWSDNEIAYRMREVELDNVIKLTRSSLGSIKSDFSSGAMSEADAREAMLALGINQAMVDWWITRWKVRLNRRKRVASTSQVLSWAKRGVIGDDGAVQALSNLGWKDPEIELLKGQIETDTADVRLRAEEKAARTEAARVAAIRQQMMRARAEQDRLRSELAKHSSPAMIAKWLKQSLITRKQGRKRLLALSWPNDDATKHIASAKGESLEEEQYQESQEPDEE